MIGRLRNYLSEAWAELRKVAWPTRSTVINLTLIVIAVSVAAGLVGHHSTCCRSAWSAASMMAI